MSFWSKGRTPNILKDWKVLDQMAQLDDLLEESKSHPVAIFKHSTSCGISHMIKDGLESAWNIGPERLQVYYLDLLANRSLSNEVAKRFQVVHQSPQMIVLKDGKVSQQASHHSISLSMVEGAIA